VFTRVPPPLTTPVAQHAGSLRLQPGGAPAGYVLCLTVVADRLFFHLLVQAYRRARPGLLFFTYASEMCLCRVWSP